ncbi:glycerol-3-phosphate dehydrogenase/oxidase [Corynebacterium kozikiae]|uniref:glycerol-3-phosphate dehydrogenase/oxidase n=1 Tax=Corynebacterium kozikiae TaxID=2968469 RepID=UPI00211C3ABF|nr:glycerol-3-phosphate dehydrogenase/oxidase [Corynebacterium sp. 76QC2CO]MCQ9343416.1 glycerol-3-phosphate dehydrogenase/oxidase [Corynebacterium sp. 76QC2CO]
MTATFTHKSYLSAEQRQAALEAMSDDQGVDILVIGGGVTGAGIALDAATRGLRTAVVEAGDWAAGTSAWSTKLVHGGLRYLYNLDFKLVAEALRERGLLLERTAPHLVKAQPFLWPLKMPVIERAYSAVGIGMYDTMAFAGAGGHRTVPAQHHFTKSGTKKIFPSIKDNVFTGSIQFYDARVDDARLVIDLVRTAAGYGALAASRTQVVGIEKNSSGRVVGAKIVDLETGEERTVKAHHIINATGVWTEESESMATKDAGLKVLASKGIHLIVPRDRIKATSGIFTQTEKSVLFFIPWQRYWIIGTTDTPYHEDIERPVATKKDIQYVLDQANKLVDDALTEDDIISTYAGLRPLLQPTLKEGSEKASTKVSREHTVTEVAPGMSVIAGGKLTTYRVMAEDAVDFALGERAKALPSVTTNIKLVGAEGYEVLAARAEALATEQGWTSQQTEHLLERYGAELIDVISAIEEDPSLGEPLKEAPQFLRADVLRAVRTEGALHLEDVLVRRVRLDLEAKDRGLSAAEEVLDIMAEELGWDDATRTKELDAYKERVEAIATAETHDTDAEAAAEVVGATHIAPRQPIQKA